MRATPQKGGAGRVGLMVAAGLALTALAVRYRARRAEEKYPPVGKFVEIDGLRLHFFEQGDGPSVLLLHGNGAYATDFVGCGLFERLAARYRVIAIDRPGFGYSERPRDRLWTPRAQAELLARACRVLEVEAPIVLGHSFGTLTALSLACYTDLAVRGLVLVSGYYFPTPRLDAVVMSPPAIPLVGDVMRYTVSPVLGRVLMPRLLRRVFAPKPVDTDFCQIVPPAMMLRPWQLKAAAEDSAFMIPAAAALESEYRQLSIPVEIFAGEGDKLVDPAKQSRRLHEELPHSRLHLLPGEGHMLHYAFSHDIAAAIDHIAAETPAWHAAMAAGQGEATPRGSAAPASGRVS